MDILGVPRDRGVRTIAGDLSDVVTSEGIRSILEVVEEYPELVSAIIDHLPFIISSLNVSAALGAPNVLPPKYKFVSVLEEWARSGEALDLCLSKRTFADLFQSLPAPFQVVLQRFSNFPTPLGFGLENCQFFIHPVMELLDKESRINIRLAAKKLHLSTLESWNKLESYNVDITDDGDARRVRIEDFDEIIKVEPATKRNITLHNLMFPENQDQLEEWIKTYGRKLRGLTFKDILAVDDSFLNYFFLLLRVNCSFLEKIEVINLRFKEEWTQRQLKVFDFSETVVFPKVTSLEFDLHDCPVAPIFNIYLPLLSRMKLMNGSVFYLKWLLSTICLPNPSRLKNLFVDVEQSYENSAGIYETLRNFISQNPQSIDHLTLLNVPKSDLRFNPLPFHQILGNCLNNLAHFSITICDSSSPVDDYVDDSPHWQFELSHIDLKNLRILDLEVLSDYRPDFNLLRRCPSLEKIIIKSNVRKDARGLFFQDSDSFQTVKDVAMVNCIDQKSALKPMKSMRCLCFITPRWILEDREMFFFKRLFPNLTVLACYASEESLRLAIHLWPTLQEVNIIGDHNKPLLNRLRQEIGEERNTRISV